MPKEIRMTMAPTATDGFTKADYLALPEEIGTRVELIGGSLIMNASPLHRHQRASYRLQDALRAAWGSEYEVFHAPLDVHLPTGDIVEPDLLVVDAGRPDDDWIHPPLALVVELVSPGSVRHDTVTKLDAYARGGVEHYWMVDTRPTHVGFRALHLVDQRYVTVAESADRIEVDEPVRLSMALDSLFRAR